MNAPAPGKGNCDLLIIDGSFLGGKQHTLSAEYLDSKLPDEENPAFNKYFDSDKAHKALLVAQVRKSFDSRKRHTSHCSSPR